MIAPDKETNPLADAASRGPEGAANTTSTESTDPAYEKLLVDIKGKPEPEPEPEPEPVAPETSEAAVETPEEARKREVDEAREQVFNLRDPNMTTPTEHAAIEGYAKEKIDPKGAEADVAYGKAVRAWSKVQNAESPKERSTAKGLHTKALRDLEKKEAEEGDLIIEEATKLKAAALASRELHEANSIKDVGLAEAMAYGEKPERDRAANILESARSDEDPRRQERRQAMAAAAVENAKIQGEAAGTAELKARATQAEKDALVDKTVVNLATAVEDLRTNPETPALDGIGTNKNMTPEDLQQVITEFFSQVEIGVDLKTPFDQVVSGPRFGKERAHDDFYYRSTKSEYKDLVFVIRYDHKSSTLERMDTVKVPQNLGPGQEALGWFADKKWRGEVDDALVATRENDAALPADGSRPFTPETPKSADLKANEKTNTKRGGAVLAGFGLSESVAAKRKPKRRSWWLSLFG